MTSDGKCRVGIDSGGTFTNVCAIRSRDGSVFTAKIRANPADPSFALASALRKILDAADCTDPSDVSFLIHGSTLATNALLESQENKVGLLITPGHPHLLEAARLNIPPDSGNTMTNPLPLVPPDRVFEVEGRMDHRGEEIQPLNEELLRETARRLQSMEVEAVAVCLHHSCANPAHEERVREIFREEYPNAFLSLSHQVLAGRREFERALATLMDASCKPVIKNYLVRSKERLAIVMRGEPPILVMKQNGSLLNSGTAMECPSAVVRSGPAAGVLSAAAVAADLGLAKVIALESGGTSTHISLIEDEKPLSIPITKINGHYANIPSFDIKSVGIGGGSILRSGPAAGLRVGPQSAGAEPGPMCFGAGGD